MSAKALLSASVSAPPAVYVEDVFSTYLYTGNGSTQTITNGIALGDNVVNYLTGKTITNIGSAITLGSLSNVNDGILETTNGTNYAFTSGTLDIYVDMGAGFAATGYLIAPQGTTNSAVYNTIDGFIVKASNDASTWTTIQTFSGYDSTYPAWNAGSFRPFTFSNTTAYRYWRLQSTDGSNDSISEWALLNNSPGIGKGGLIYYKQRDGSWFPTMVDTVRGLNNRSFTHLTDPGDTGGNFTALSNGYQINDGNAIQNGIGLKYASWTFRKAEKFFDVVTFTAAAGAYSATVNHSLGSTPGCIIVKCTSSGGAVGDWNVWHRSLASDKALVLNSSSAQNAPGTNWITANSTSFSVNGSLPTDNATYVAYLFAHDAGGFGDAGTDSVVSCGSYTGNGSTSGPTVDLGWEPQWLLIKRASAGTGGWFLLDSMRGIATGSADASLQAESANAENTANDRLSLTSTGFQLTTTSSFFNNSGDTYIYIAIRRGPMKTPESGTEVFATVAASGSTGTSRSIGFPSDFLWARRRDFAYAPVVVDRLRGYSATSGGSQPALETTNTGAENPFTTAVVYDVWNDTVKDGAVLGSTSSALWYHFRRAPGFFDVVAYTGTSASITVNHNLGVTPELIIGKCRSAVFPWIVYHQFLGTGAYIALNTDAARSLVSLVSAVSATSFTGEANAMSYSGNTHVAYLFATLAGISKVGSYTGTGTTLSIDCGFTAGARFVLIKRTDSTGDWYVWDTARGIISGNDPYLLLNSTAAEVTNTDYIDPLSSGFQVSSTAPAAINASGGTYIFLAIA